MPRGVPGGGYRLVSQDYEFNSVSSRNALDDRRKGTTSEMK